MLRLFCKLIFHKDIGNTLIKFYRKWHKMHKLKGKCSLLVSTLSNNTNNTKLGHKGAKQNIK